MEKNSHSFGIYHHICTSLDKGRARESKMRYIFPSPNTKHSTGIYLLAEIASHQANILNLRLLFNQLASFLDMNSVIMFTDLSSSFLSFGFKKNKNRN